MKIPQKSQAIDKIFLRNLGFFPWPASWQPKCAVYIRMYVINIIIGQFFPAFDTNWSTLYSSRTSAQLIPICLTQYLMQTLKKWLKRPFEVFFEMFYF